MYYTPCLTQPLDTLASQLNMISFVLILVHSFLMEAYFAIKRLSTKISDSTENEVPQKIHSFLSFQIV